MCRLNGKIYVFYLQKAVYDYDIHMYQNRAKKYPYESVLDLNRVETTYVDYYYCVKNSSDPNASIESLLERQEASQIYVYVDDRRKPLVSISVSDLEANQFDEILIPCKPSSKNFDVQLFKEGIMVSKIKKMLDFLSIESRITFQLTLFSLAS